MFKQVGLIGAGLFAGVIGSCLALGYRAGTATRHSEEEKCVRDASMILCFEEMMAKNQEKLEELSEKLEDLGAKMKEAAENMETAEVAQQQEAISSTPLKDSPIAEAAADGTAAPKFPADNSWFSCCGTCLLF